MIIEILVYSIKVEDSLYGSVDSTHTSPSSDVPCSSTSLSGDIKRLGNPEELLRISTGAKLQITWFVYKCDPKDAKEAVCKAKQVNINIATRKEEYI